MVSSDGLLIPESDDERIENLAARIVAFALRA
jgi:hypothetical protein